MNIHAPIEFLKENETEKGHAENNYRYISKWSESPLVEILNFENFQVIFQRSLIFHFLELADGQYSLDWCLNG